jgi:putative flippase GtrA
VLKKQIINFIIVGIFNTLFGYAVYAAFIFLGFNYIASVFLATILGILFNFKTIGKFVFKSHDNTLIVKFIFVYAIVFIVNIVLIKTLKDFGLNDYISGLFAIIPASITSFILNKYFVFRR